MAKVDLSLNPPTNKKTLTAENMLFFIEKYGTDEDVAWYIDLLDNNHKKKTNNLTGDVVDGYNYPPIREAFAKRFFPAISDAEKKKGKKTTVKETQKSRIENLRKRVNK